MDRPDLFELPVSVMLALWAPVPSSYGLAAVQGPDGAHEVIDLLPDGWGPLPLVDWFARARPLARCVAVLPAPSDPLPGLAAALEAGEGVLVETALASQTLPGSSHRPTGQTGRRLLLVPEPAGTSVRWIVSEAPAAAPPFDPSHARREVHRATEEAIAALTELDLARERPELADSLTDLVTAVLDPRLAPASLDERRRTLLERALRLRAICELALEDDGAAASAAHAASRRAVLMPLQAVARRAISAATESWAH